MDSVEFLLFIPGLIYGVGVVDLLKILNGKMYWEILAWGTVLFLILIIQWFTLYERLDIISMNIGLFTVLLLGPLVYTRTCTVLTPEEGDDPKKYFLQTRKEFFSWMMAGLIANTLMQFVIEDDGKGILRMIGLPFMIACIVSDKLWIRVLALIVTLLMIIYVIFNSAIQ